MILQLYSKVLAAIVLVSMIFAAAARADDDDWAVKEFGVTGDGIMTLTYPLSWGKKPSYDRGESITDLKFGPYGPKSKPIFLAHVQAIVAVDPIAAASLMELSKQMVEQYRATAFETDIPISDFQGPNNFGHLFSITDSKPKRGEFDYLTMAVVASDNLLAKVYFFSSDGAPNFGSDAMQMLRSIRYTPPEVKEEK